MAKVVRTQEAEAKSDVQRTADDVKKSLSFNKSGLDSVKEEDLVENDEVVEEETDVVEEDDSDVDAEEDKVEDTKVDFKSLYEQEKLERQKLVDKITSPKKEDESDKAPAAPEPIEFIKGSELDDDTFGDIVSSKEAFTKTLNEFGNRVRIDTESRIMTELPSIIQSITSYQVKLNDLNRSFYDENKDLVPLKKFVGSIADDIIKSRGINDLDSYEELLKELPILVRKELNMAPPEKRKPTSSGIVPRGQRRLSGKPTDDDLSPLQKDIQKALKYSKQRNS